MEIRSITLGVETRWPLHTGTLDAAGLFLGRAREEFVRAGFGVQTTRLSTPPAATFVPPGSYSELALRLEQACLEREIDYCASGAIGLGASWGADTAQAVVGALTNTERFFSSIAVAADRLVNARAARASAEVIVRLGRESEQGFGNLRFAAIANVPSNVPFFPSAYHQPGEPCFSIALQAADVVLEAFAGPGSLRQAEDRLVAMLQARAGEVERLALGLERDLGVLYGGLDLSPAPFPAPETSVGAALEELGVERLGAGGTVFAAWRLTRALARVQVRRRGFSGLMLPVLEDSVLAQRSGAGSMSLASLLLASAVCGTGLDTVPLPGSISQAEVLGILLDMAALSCALDKPLTARLFPIPGKAAGELTDFSFPYFANGRVLHASGFGADALARRAEADGS